ncbi:MAG: AEC family transporter [Faecalibacterium sp.]|jgi:predicted permease|nr:AEC family transporter [Faecalibacterium sp.]
MLDHLLFSLNSTVPLFAIMVLGYLLRQKGFLSEGFIADANKFVFHISLPALLFIDMASTDVRTVFDGPFVLFCLFATASSILVIWALAKLFIRDKSVVGEFVQASYRSSAAILGSALTAMLYGTSGFSGLMILGSVPLYNIFAVLILVLESPDAAISAGNLRARLGGSLKRIATNPILLGILAGFVFGFLRIPLPTMVSNTFSTISKMTTPLALIAIGAGFQGKAALGRLKLTGIATALKLMVLPAVFLPLAVHFGFTGEKFAVLLVMLGSITTPASYVMAKQMGHEGTLTASVCVATTALGALSLTFWLFLAGCLGWI